MRMLISLIILSCLFLTKPLSAQEEKMIKLEPGISYNFKVDGKPISATEAKELLSVDPDALYSFQSARQNKTVSHIFAGIGAAGLAYSAVAMVNHELHTKWGLFAGSLALVGFAIPLYISGEKQMCGALTAYNQRFKTETSYYPRVKANVQLAVTANGPGLVLNF